MALARWREQASRFLLDRLRHEFDPKTAELRNELLKLTREFLFGEYIGNPDMEILQKYGQATKPEYTNVSIYNEETKLYDISTSLAYCKLYIQEEVERLPEYDFLVPTSKRVTHLYIGELKESTPGLISWAKEFTELRKSWETRRNDIQEACYDTSRFKTFKSLVKRFPELEHMK